MKSFEKISQVFTYVLKQKSSVRVQSDYLYKHLPIRSINPLFGFTQESQLIKIIADEWGKKS